jgi:stage V sporulation protein G
MEITEVRITLADDAGNGNGRLLAFASITLDGCFAVRDIKVIDGRGGVFVAMPSRRLISRCPRCGHKNHLAASYCNHCGGRRADAVPSPDPETGHSRLHADVCHPVTNATRLAIEGAVVAAWREAVDAKAVDMVIGEGVANG